MEFVSNRSYNVFFTFKLVDQISNRYDQKLKLTQNCKKFEREEDEIIEGRISCSIGTIAFRYNMNIKLYIYIYIYIYISINTL